MSTTTQTSVPPARDLLAAAMRERDELERIQSNRAQVGSSPSLDLAYERTWRRLMPLLEALGEVYGVDMWQAYNRCNVARRDRDERLEVAA